MHKLGLYAQAEVASAQAEIVSTQILAIINKKIELIVKFISFKLHNFSLL